MLSTDDKPYTQELEKWLREDGLLGPGPAEIIPLTGGVSCDIRKVEQDGHVFIVKRALEKLKVASEWHADVSRNAVEARFYQEMALPLDGHVPKVLFHNSQHGYFVMEYLGQGWENWKELLMSGRVDARYGAVAGRIMGRLHSLSWHDRRFAEIFNKKDNFKQLRTDPYLRAAAQKHSGISGKLLDEADRLDFENTCLIHGDFSPKNLLIKDGDMMLLDAEVAVIGDPAFDMAFLLTHLVIKAIYFESRSDDYLKIAEAAWQTYTSILKENMTPDFEQRSIHLLSCLLIARVDGKSPVEYLDEPKQNTVRDFGLSLLTVRNPRFSELREMLVK